MGPGASFGLEVTACVAAGAGLGLGAGFGLAAGFFVASGTLRASSRGCLGRDLNGSCFLEEISASGYPNTGR